MEDERSAWQVNYAILTDLLVTFIRDIFSLEKYINDPGIPYL